MAMSMPSRHMEMPMLNTVSDVRRRLRQANLFGPAGYVSADDGEVIEFSQQGAMQRPDGASLVELGGTGTATRTEHTVTETLIRSMYAYWRRVIDA